VGVYIPFVERSELFDVIICSPLDKVQELYLPEAINTEDGNHLNESIATLEYFPFLKSVKDLEVFIKKNLNWFFNSLTYDPSIDR